MDLFGYRELTKQLSTLVAVTRVVSDRLLRLESTMGEIKDALEVLKTEVAETAAAVGRCIAKVQELLTQIEEGRDVAGAVAEAKVQLDAMQAAVDAVAPPPVE